ncbi:hypothetical protein PUNSTDRAFT_88921 [Punctularia strigosozonata HHB-11173 SS5]|uniref:uncharacterized protein n=1 Tax=Punctularia strigosozonata (strain HHB-11173) TaxID=741275 RepID=UPI0004417BAD|nr:uncharacterized protein PUNSTDRAFT_88921 [Punctularia strigosozonata HHB-11173 SS5]EIN08114.1 hypothetical protein PUNSTDRAFT_88921 [Punctularia strigosozonata HHB-11173 SS5]
MSEPSSVTAALQYVVTPAHGERLFRYTSSDHAQGGRLTNIEREEHNVQIENLRGKESAATLDSHGFQFFRRPAKHREFRVDEDIQKEYYLESEHLIKELTGASKVVFFDHTIRRRNPELNGDDPQNRQPAAGVHVDQTSPAAVARVHRHLPAADVPRLLEKRFQIINLWRPISHPAYDWPLALCDYRSIDPKNDLIPVALIYPDKEGETYSVKYNPNHRWKYVRGLEPDEGVLIKCFDSVQDGSVAVLTPHTAFEDPSTPKDAPYRQSIELRALVFYD